VAGIGRFEMPMAELSLRMGGHVRVGLEDNLYLSKGVLARGNQELVAAAVRMVSRSGRALATPAEAREILELPSREG
jgi:3-keto-5-aminohexanoate cleavage enzyme